MRTNDAQIEMYLDGELQGDALKQFEATLKQDTSLANRLKFHQDLAASLGDSQAIDVQKQITEIGRSFFQESASEKPAPKLVPVWRRPLAIAASFLVLLAVSYFTWQAVSGLAPSGERLFAQNFTSYPLDQVVRGSEATQSDFEQTVQLYLDGHYQQASEAFRTQLSLDPQNEKLKFSLAQSLLSETPPAFDAASPLLESLVSTGTSSVVPASKWYLALVYVHNGDFKQAMPLLQEVKAAGGSRGRMATELLEAL
ncbi:MAG: hypothetical protein KDC34_16220 [Saprospiraceae bacterium]|nr:hypothetical protein [Saprospiraceae bacterium]